MSEERAVVMDPPYELGIAGWDTAPDIEDVLRECGRIARDFVAFFGQMPTLHRWNHAALGALRWHFCEEIVWAKRNCTPQFRIQRAHETIMVYAVGRRRQFHERRGPYEDVKLPGILVDTYTIDALDRYVKSLWRRIDGRGVDMRHRGGSKRNEVYALKQRYSANPEGPMSRRTADFTNVWSFLPERLRRKTGEHTHPTIKPLALMDRLVAMLSPCGGIVLDPFAGTGTTGVACLNSGRHFVGIEREAEYVQIARARLAHASSETRAA